MITEDVQFMNGEVMEGREIGKLVEFIVNKFAEEGLNYEKAKFVLKRAEMTIEGQSRIQPMS